MANSYANVFAVPKTGFRDEYQLVKYTINSCSTINDNLFTCCIKKSEDRENIVPFRISYKFSPLLFEKILMNDSIDIFSFNTFLCCINYLYCINLAYFKDLTYYTKNYSHFIIICSGIYQLNIKNIYELCFNSPIEIQEEYKQNCKILLDLFVDQNIAQSEAHNYYNLINNVLTTCFSHIKPEISE